MSALDCSWLCINPKAKEKKIVHEGKMSRGGPQAASPRFCSRMFAFWANPKAYVLKGTCECWFKAVHVLHCLNKPPLAELLLGLTADTWLNPQQWLDFA